MAEECGEGGCDHYDSLGVSPLSNLANFRSLYAVLLPIREGDDLRYDVSHGLLKLMIDCDWMDTGRQIHETSCQPYSELTPDSANCSLKTDGKHPNSAKSLVYPFAASIWQRLSTIRMSLRVVSTQVRLRTLYRRR